jgi:hypothetical protein
MNPTSNQQAVLHLRKVLNKIGGVCGTVQKTHDLAEQVREGARYLVKQRDYAPNSMGTYEGYQWHYTLFADGMAMLSFLSSQADAVNCESPWQHVGVWDLNTCQEIEIGFAAYPLKRSKLREQTPHGKWVEDEQPDDTSG